MARPLSAVINDSDKGPQSYASNRSCCSELPSVQTPDLRQPALSIQAEVGPDLNAQLNVLRSFHSEESLENALLTSPASIFVTSPSSTMDRGDGNVRWSPTQDRHDFLSINNGGAGISLFKATGLAVPEQFDYSLVTKHTHCPAVTTYDWSPTVSGLVAVGTKSGEIHLLRVDDNSNDSMLLPLKLQRSVQSVAFNTAGLLAVGLDRVRNDQCLHIWDVNQRLSRWDSSKYGWQNHPQGTVPPGTLQPGEEPIYRLEPGVVVSSVRFFEDQPQTLVVGIKNQRLTIHDLRDPAGAVLSFTNTRNNNNLAIDYADPTYFASSNLENSSITVWDRRAGTKGGASAPYRSFAESDAVPWGCVLKADDVIRPGKDSTIRSLRYCRDVRGMLGVLTNAGELQVLQLQRTYLYDYEVLEDSPELLEIRRSYTLEFPYHDPNFKGTAHDRANSFDWMRLGSDKFQPRVITRRLDASLEIKLVPTGVEAKLFEFLDMGTNHQKVDNIAMPVFEDAKVTMSVYGPLICKLEGRDITFGQQPPGTTQNTASDTSNPDLDDDGEDTLRKAAERVYQRVSWKHTMLATNVADATKVAAGNAQQPSPNADIGNETKKEYSSSKDRHAENFWRAIDVQILENVYGALSSITRGRVVDGYSFNCKRNQRIVANDPWLQDVWSWIEGAQLAVKDDGMRTTELDLAFMGVHSVWNEDLGLTPEARIIDANDRSKTLKWASTISSINKRKGSEIFQGVATSKAQHRQLCLSICGWGKSAIELDEDLENFEKRGQYTKAAVWALCEKQPKRAVEALQRGGSDLMFVALALELQGAGAAPIDKSKWDLLFKQHPQMAEDSYLRAIYALISTGDWKAIANEDSMPLRERVGIALRNFSDSELTSWLDAQLKLAVDSGDIEGVVLAGITEKMMDILANYVKNFGDNQTAVLIMSFTVPGYFNDIRYNQMREEYRRYLNYHRLHVKRALFDSQSAKLSRLRDGTSKIKPPPRQVTLRCVHCNSNLSNDLKNTDNLPDVKAAQSTVADTRNPLIVSGINGGISCPTCGKHLPRCAVCLQTLGLPRTDFQNPNLGTADAEDQKEDLQRNFITFCMKCPHAMHADHAEQWFSRHTECPVSECRCQCYVDEARIRKEREAREEFERKLAIKRKNGKTEMGMIEGADKDAKGRAASAE